MLLLIFTAVPDCSLFWPEATTFWPGATPDRISETPPSRRPTLTNDLPHDLRGVSPCSRQSRRQDVVAIEARDDRRLRHGDHVGCEGSLTRTCRNWPGRMVLPVAVGDGRLHRDEPRLRIDARVDADDVPAIDQIAFREAERHRLPELQLRGQLLGNGEVDLHSAEVLEGRDHGARLQVLTDIDPRNAGDAVERRLQRLLIDRRLEARHARAGGRQAARCAWSWATSVPEPRARSAVARSRFCSFRLTAAFDIEEVGPLDRIVELNQDLALREVLVGLEIDLLDDAADLHGELDAVFGPGGADRGDARLPLARLRPRRPTPSAPAAASSRRSSAII